MDEARVEQTIQDHADAVVPGDMAHVINDFSEQIRPIVPELAKALPLPVDEAGVRSVEVGADEAIARIQHTGESGEMTIRSHWREIDGTPQIVGGEPEG